MKRKLLGVCSLIVVLGMFSQSTGVSANGYGQEINVKVSSFNIFHGVGLDGVLDLERTAGVIRDAGVEIVGLQEVDRFYGTRSDFRDQAKELATILGYHYVFGANLNLAPAEGRTENRQYGTAILSKYPIIDSENIHLSSFGKEQRGLLWAKVNVRGIHTNVYNTHLGLDVPSRMAQVDEIIEYTQAKQGPRILFGDLNAEPDSQEFELLLEAGNFMDSFAGIENADTFPVINPIKRIDYILTSPEIEVFDQHVIYSEASDHLPITATIKLFR